MRVRALIRGLALILGLGLLAACGQTPIPPPTAPPPTTAAPPTTVAAPTPPPATPGELVISELVPGVPGNNNYDVIELYNRGTEPVDLRGWSLWYRLAPDQEPQRVYRWTRPAQVPGYGHYLLVREGEDVGVVPDATFTTPLYERKGGVVLQDPEGQVVDALGWGDAPPSFSEGTPAPAPREGASLERRPGGEAGSTLDSDDNRTDVWERPTPDFQGSGSPITPLLAARMAITVTAPVSVTPGTAFTLAVAVRNQTGVPVRSGAVAVPVPEGFAVVATPPAAIEDDALVRWSLPALDDGAAATWSLALRSPWRYGTAYLGGSYVEAEDWPLRMYAARVPLAVGGGAIPIVEARDLQGQMVTVEGIATMYTGGFYAGSTGTKFYLQDDTGGVQVYCPGGKGEVHVDIGDRVRVTGEVEVYRDAVEIVPSTYPDDVTVLAEDATVPAPDPVSADTATRDTAVLGRLIVVEGIVTRFEEFNYSYELDLLDEHGDTVLVYLEKDTYVNPEFVEVGKRYRIQGISELYSSRWQLKPRLASDFIRVYPPELMLDVMAQNSVASGGLITYTLTAYNHTAAPLTQVQIVAAPPPDATLVAVLDGGSSAAETLTWTASELAPEGGSVAVRYVVRAGAGDRVVAPPAEATADQWPGPVASAPWATFVGRGVPIWAVQGAGMASPYVHSVTTVEGVVTGVFPELEGYWIQSLTPDDDPATSEGLFVLVSAAGAFPRPGDRVQVTGKVREKSGQTLLYAPEAEDLVVLAGGQPLPEAVELDPPREGAGAYYEALEGMLVAVTEPAVAVGPTSKYGEAAVVRSRWGITRVMRGDPQGMLIFLDDGSSATHSTQATLPYALKSGDRVGGVLGPLAFTYENYKIQPILTPTVISMVQPLPSLAPVGPDAVSVATFNVENFFDIAPPHPSDPPRPSLDAYRRKVAKVVASIEALGAPTVLGLQEVEDLGVLQDVAEDPALSPYGYVPVLIEGFDSRGIDVGYLVRGDRATVVGASQHPAPEGLTSRPPLLITVTVHLAGGDRTLYVLNNHFTSMAGGELATEPRRTAQAAWNVSLMEPLLAADPDALVVVMGDLNSFYDAPPIDTLRAGGLRHVYELVAPDRPYTYIYQGMSETLDHILVSPVLYDHLTQVTALHLNADYPPPRPDDASPRRVSDHDPLVAVFEFVR